MIANLELQPTKTPAQVKSLNCESENRTPSSFKAAYGWAWSSSAWGVPSGLKDCLCGEPVEPASLVGLHNEKPDERFAFFLSTKEEMGALRATPARTSSPWVKQTAKISGPWTKLTAPALLSSLGISVSEATNDNFQQPHLSLILRCGDIQPNPGPSVCCNDPFCDCLYFPRRPERQQRPSYTPAQRATTAVGALLSQSRERCEVRRTPSLDRPVGQSPYEPEAPSPHTTTLNRPPVVGDCERTTSNDVPVRDGHARCSDRICYADEHLVFHIKSQLNHKRDCATLYPRNKTASATSTTNGWIIRGRVCNVCRPSPPRDLTREGIHPNPGPARLSPFTQPRELIIKAESLPGRQVRTLELAKDTLTGVQHLACCRLVRNDIPIAAVNRRRPMCSVCLGVDDPDAVEWLSATIYSEMGPPEYYYDKEGNTVHAAEHALASHHLVNGVGTHWHMCWCVRYEGVNRSLNYTHPHRILGTLASRVAVRVNLPYQFVAANLDSLVLRHIPHLDYHILAAVAKIGVYCCTSNDEQARLLEFVRRTLNITVLPEDVPTGDVTGHCYLSYTPMYWQIHQWVTHGSTSLARIVKANGTKRQLVEAWFQCSGAALRDIPIMRDTINRRYLLLLAGIEPNPGPRKGAGKGEVEPARHEPKSKAAGTPKRKRNQAPQPKYTQLTKTPIAHTQPAKNRKGKEPAKKDDDTYSLVSSTESRDGWMGRQLTREGTGWQPVVSTARYAPRFGVPVLVGRERRLLVLMDNDNGEDCGENVLAYYHAPRVDKPKQSLEIARSLRQVDTPFATSFEVLQANQSSAVQITKALLGVTCNHVAPAKLLVWENLCPCLSMRTGSYVFTNKHSNLEVYYLYYKDRHEVVLVPYKVDLDGNWEDHGCLFAKLLNGLSGQPTAIIEGSTSVNQNPPAINYNKIGKLCGWSQEYLKSIMEPLTIKHNRVELKTSLSDLNEKWKEAADALHLAVRQDCGSDKDHLQFKPRQIVSNRPRSVLGGDESASSCQEATEFSPDEDHEGAATNPTTTAPTVAKTDSSHSDQEVAVAVKPVVVQSKLSPHAEPFVPRGLHPAWWPDQNAKPAPKVKVATQYKVRVEETVKTKAVVQPDRAIAQLVAAYGGDPLSGLLAKACDVPIPPSSSGEPSQHLGTNDGDNQHDLVGQACRIPVPSSSGGASERIPVLGGPVGVVRPKPPGLSHGFGNCDYTVKLASRIDDWMAEVEAELNPTEDVGPLVRLGSERTTAQNLDPGEAHQSTSQPLNMPHETDSLHNVDLQQQYEIMAVIEAARGLGGVPGPSGGHPGLGETSGYYKRVVFDRLDVTTASAYFDNLYSELRGRVAKEHVSNLAWRNATIMQEYKERLALNELYIRELRRTLVTRLVPCVAQPRNDSLSAAILHRNALLTTAPILVKNHNQPNGYPTLDFVTDAMIYEVHEWQRHAYLVAKHAVPDYPPLTRRPIIQCASITVPYRVNGFGATDGFVHPILKYVYQPLVLSAGLDSQHLNLGKELTYKEDELTGEIYSMEVDSTKIIYYRHAEIAHLNFEEGKPDFSGGVYRYPGIIGTLFTPKTVGTLEAGNKLLVVNGSAVEKQKPKPTLLGPVGTGSLAQALCGAVEPMLDVPARLGCNSDKVAGLRQKLRRVGMKDWLAFGSASGQASIGGRRHAVYACCGPTNPSHGREFLARGYALSVLIPIDPTIPSYQDNRLQESWHTLSRYYQDTGVDTTGGQWYWQAREIITIPWSAQLTQDLKVMPGVKYVHNPATLTKDLRLLDQTVIRLRRFEAVPMSATKLNQNHCRVKTTITPIPSTINNGKDHVYRLPFLTHKVGSTTISERYKVHYATLRQATDARLWAGIKRDFQLGKTELDSQTIASILSTDSMLAGIANATFVNAKDVWELWFHQQYNYITGRYSAVESSDVRVYGKTKTSSKGESQPGGSRGHCSLCYNVPVGKYRWPRRECPVCCPRLNNPNHDLIQFHYNEQPENLMCPKLECKPKLKEQRPKFTGPDPKEGVEHYPVGAITAHDEEHFFMGLPTCTTRAKIPKTVKAERRETQGVLRGIGFRAKPSTMKNSQHNMDHCLQGRVLARPKNEPNLPFMRELEDHFLGVLEAVGLTGSYVEPQHLVNAKTIEWAHANGLKPHPQWLQSLYTAYSGVPYVGDGECFLDGFDAKKRKQYWNALPDIVHLDGFVEAVKRAQCAKDYRYVGKRWRIKIFIKQEWCEVALENEASAVDPKLQTQGQCNPRPIFDMPTVLHLIIGPWTRPMTEKVHTKWSKEHPLTYAGGLRPDELNSVLRSEVDALFRSIRGGEFFCSDFSAFDASYSVRLLRLTRLAYKHCFGFPLELPAISAIMGYMDAPVCTTADGRVVQPVGINISGRDDTALMNVIWNGISQTLAWHYSTCVAKNQPMNWRVESIRRTMSQLKLLILGDDTWGVNRLTDPDYTAYSRGLGLMGFTADPIVRAQDARCTDFLACRPMPSISNGKPTVSWGPILGRRAYKLGCWRQPSFRTDHWLVATSKAYLRIANMDPVMQAIARKQLQCTPIDVNLDYNDKMALTIGLNPHNPLMQTPSEEHEVDWTRIHDHYNVVYGITKLELDSLLAAVNSVTQCPVMLRHPVMDRVFCKDLDLGS